MTEAGFEFFLDLHRTIRALAFYYSMAERIDRVDEVLREAAKEVDLPAVEDPQDPALRTFATYSRLLNETIVVRSVDSYLAYVADLLTQVFRAKPEVLRSPDTVRLDEVLQFSLMEDFISFVAERRVDSLTQRGVRDLSDDLSRRLGIPLFENEAALLRAVRLIESRNLIVHNRGIVDRRFKERVPDSPATIGKRLPLPKTGDELNFLIASVRRLDNLVAKKFDLRRPRTRKSVVDTLDAEAARAGRSG